jgi:phage gp29-like protein
MQFFDWFKQKLTPAQVKERQTDSPRSTQLHREFAGHPSKGLTPARLASILLAAEEGDMIAQAELFMDMREKDTHIDAEMHKREMAVKKLDWTLEPPRNATAKEEANTQLLEDLIRDELDIGSIRMDALDAIGHSYSCIELGWGRTAQGLWFPNQIEHRPPSWFTCPPDQRNTLHLRDTGSSYGVPLQPFGWIVHQHKSRAGYIARTGLYRSLAWPYLFKNYSVRDLAEFLEIYGLPIRVGKYPATASDKEKKDLLRTVLSIGHNAAGIIPDSMQLELQSVLASGNADAFQAMIDWCEASQSKAILGGTLTSSTGANGNRSLGDVHNEVRLDIRDDDATQLDQTLSAHLVYPMAMLNGLFADNRCPSFVSDTQEPDDLSLYAEALPKLAAAGARIPVSYVNKKLKIPEPEEGEAILTVGPQPLPAEPAQQAAASLAGRITNITDGAANTGGAPLSRPGQGDNPVQRADSDPPGQMLDLLGKTAQPTVDAMLDTVRAMLDSAEDLPDAMRRLAGLFPDLDAASLADVLANALLAAHLAGQNDIAEGR